MKIAIVGAAGFLGSRSVEYLTLGHGIKTRPIVRKYSDLARLSRFTVDWRIADAMHESELTKAFDGCDFVIHSIMGDNKSIACCARPAYNAAQAVGIKKIIYISSAAIYDQLQGSEANESARIRRSRLGQYSSAKLQAEQEFMSLSSRGSVKVVALRPSIIIGPRSHWIAEPTKQLLTGKVFLADGGVGWCNCIYVDNLIDIALLACHCDTLGSEVFNVDDNRNLTWMQYYEHLATHLGISHQDIQAVPPPPPERSRFRSTRLFKFLSSCTPPLVKLALRKSALIRHRADDFHHNHSNEGSLINPIIAALHITPWQLSTVKLRESLVYKPTVDLDESFRRSIGWLRFAGIL